MKMRRIVSLLCTMALLVATFAGCGSSSTSAQAGDTQTASKDIPTLTWWLIGNPPPDLDQVVAKINEYTAPKIGVKVDIKMASWGEWNQKVNQIVNTGEKFDIMFGDYTYYGKFVQKGAFADITDLVQKEAPDLYKFIPEKVWEGTKVDGKIYSVPTYKDSSMTQYWCIDDTYVQKYNIDMSSLKTMDDLDKVVTKIKQGEGKSTYPILLEQNEGFPALLGNYDDLALCFQPVGVRFDDKSRKVVSVLEQPDSMANLKMLHKWYQEGIINPDAPTTKDYQKGKIFMSAQGFPGAELSWQAEMGVAKYDTVPVLGPVYSDSTIQGSVNGISSNSEHKAEALKLLQLVNTDQKLRDMLAYGLEGTDFKYVSDKVVKPLTDAWGGGNYAVGTFFNMATQEGAPENQWELVKKQNEEAVSSTCLGFTPDTKNITNELTNCEAVWDKYRYELKTGASDPEVMVPKIITELKAAGMDKIISEIQSQIDNTKFD